MKKILIYSPYANVGHFDSWNKLIKQSLVSLGFEVRLSSEFISYETLLMYEKSEVRKFYENVAINDSILAWSPHLVLHTFFDSLNASSAEWSYFNNRFPFKWAGIYFRPHNSQELLSNKFFISNQFYGMLYVAQPDLDLPGNDGIKTGYCVDIGNSELPSRLSPLAKKLIYLANGRKIVFAGGSIGSRKNMLQWIKLIKISDPEKFFFLQVGKFHYNEFNRRAVEIIKRFNGAPPENCIVMEDYFRHEKYFNELISISNFIFGVYKDFEGSSNLISKSALLRIPILVNKYSRIMAPLVQEYSLGKVIDGKSAVLVKDTLEKMVISFDYFTFKEGCRMFLKEHGNEAFNKNLNQFLFDL
jgi:hypothetical protein